MTSLIVTLIFVLADGSPAKRAFAFCQGIAMFEAGNDFEDNRAEEGSRILLDSRGATVVVADAPQTIRCWAIQEGQRFSGPVVLTRSGQVIRVQLKGGGTHGDS